MNQKVTELVTLLDKINDSKVTFSNGVYLSTRDCG